MPNYGLKAAIGNISVENAPDNDIAFTSKQTLFKVFKEGQTSIAGTGSDTTIDITHGLGYLPACLVTADGISGVGATKRLLLNFRSSGANRLEWYVDNSQLHIEVNADAGINVDIKYYIFIDSGE